MNTPETDKADKKDELLDSLSKGLALLRLFATGVATLTIQDVADRLGVTRAAARRLLLTLEHHGYVTQEGRFFSVTPKVIELGYAYFAAMDLPTLARPAMRSLADEIKETCSLAVLDSSSIVLIAREEPEQLVRLDMTVGRRMPAYAHSLGRTLLAYLSNEKWEQYLARTELRKFTRFTVTSRSGLERSLKQVRADGYCVLLSEIVDGLAGVSVPVRNRAGEVVASMGVSMVLGSRSSEHIVREYLPALQRAVQRVEEVLQAMRS